MQPDFFGIFDAHHPPAEERISDCVHCGFCLPTCPTYALWGEEMDSPRGRIYLMKLGKEGAVPLDDSMFSTSTLPGLHGLCDRVPIRRAVRRVDRGVRAQLERNYRRSPADRAFRGMIFQLFPYPTRLRAAAVWGRSTSARGSHLLERSGLRKRLPARLEAVEELMPPRGCAA